MATKAEHVISLKAAHADGSLTKMVNGERITLTTSEWEATIDQWATANAASDVRDAIIASGGASADYASFRTNDQVSGSYLSIPDQLDQLWHDIDDGKFGSDSKTGDWYLAVKATKDRYTKP